MNKYFSLFLLLLFSSAAFAENFRIGDTAMDNYGGSVRTGQVLDITSVGLVRTTNTAGDYIKINRLSKYESVNSFRAGNLLVGYRTYKIGDLVFDTFAGGGSMWNLGEILDITPEGLVKTSNTVNTYIDIGRLENYAKVNTYEGGSWLGSNSVVFRVGDQVVDDFAGTSQFGLIEDISSNGLVRTTNTNGRYIELDRLQTK